MLTGYYKKKTKKDFKERFVNDIEIFLKKKKTKIVNMIANNIKIFLTMKNKDQLSIEKNIPKYKK